MIYRRPLILKHMLALFLFGPCTNTIITVSVNLPGLPLDLWYENALPKICSLIGTPLCTDVMTRRKDRISYARVLIEVDVAKELTREVII